MTLFSRCNAWIIYCGLLWFNHFKNILWYLLPFGCASIARVVPPDFRGNHRHISPRAESMSSTDTIANSVLVTLIYVMLCTGIHFNC